MQKFGSCEFTVNDTVSYISRDGVHSEASYIKLLTFYQIKTVVLKTDRL